MDPSEDAYSIWALCQGRVTDQLLTLQRHQLGSPGNVSIPDSVALRRVSAERPADMRNGALGKPWGVQHSRSAGMRESVQREIGCI